MAVNSNTTPEALEPHQQRAKTLILAARQGLQAAGMTFVAMHFDGAGDEGVNEAVKGYDSESYEHETEDPVDHDLSELQEAFEALVPFDYEDGCGGFGDVVLDVQSGTITITRNDRFEDYTTTPTRSEHGPSFQACPKHSKTIWRKARGLSRHT